MTPSPVSDIPVAWDTATVKTSSDAKTIFDTGRIAIEVDELA